MSNGFYFIQIKNSVFPNIFFKIKFWSQIVIALLVLVLIIFLL
jgi:hypothetical protein